VQVPKEYIPGVTKGLEEMMTSGALAGFPVVDLVATLYDGSYHDVDSSVLAFQIAARQAFRQAVWNFFSPGNPDGVSKTLWHPRDITSSSSIVLANHTAARRASRQCYKELPGITATRQAFDDFGNPAAR
jgi:hypothetical protein